MRATRPVPYVSVTRTVPVVDRQQGDGQLAHQKGAAWYEPLGTFPLWATRTRKTSNLRAPPRPDGPHSGQRQQVQQPARGLSPVLSGDRQRRWNVQIVQQRGGDRLGGMRGSVRPARSGDEVLQIGVRCAGR